MLRARSHTTRRSAAPARVGRTSSTCSETIHGDAAGRDGLRAGHGLRDRDSDVRHDAAADGPEDDRRAADRRVHGCPGGQGRDIAGAARQRSGGHRVHGSRPEQRPERCEQRRAHGRGAERGDVPRGDAAACGWELHGDGGAAQLQPRLARPRRRADDRFSARVTQTGTYVNCATGIGSGKDTNGANNSECASTLVTAPVTPPTTTPTADDQAEAEAAAEAAG